MGTVVITPSSTQKKKEKSHEFSSFADASSHHGHGHPVSHALPVLCHLECLRFFFFSSLTTIILTQNIGMCTIVHFTVLYHLRTGNSEWWHHLKICPESTPRSTIYQSLDFYPNCFGQFLSEIGNTNAIFISLQNSFLFLLDFPEQQVCQCDYLL